MEHLHVTIFLVYMALYSTYFQISQCNVSLIILQYTNDTQCTHLCILCLHINTKIIPARIGFNDIISYIKKDYLASRFHKNSSKKRESKRR